MRAAADFLRDAGDVVVVWGERVASGERGAQALEALLALAGSLGIDGKDESGLIGVPAGTNGAACARSAVRPASGRGSRTRSGRGPRGHRPAGVRGRAARGPAHATPAWSLRLFRDDALDEHADVVFPAPVYAEKEGTVTHPDGRIQRVRQALGHRGESRPAWWVLADLCERAGAGLGALSAPMVTEAARRGGALLRGPHARGDRRPGRALAGPRGRLGARRRGAVAEPLTDPPAASRRPPRWRSPRRSGTVPRPSTRPRCASWPPARAPSCRPRTPARSASTAATTCASRSAPTSVTAVRRAHRRPGRQRLRQRRPPDRGEAELAPAPVVAVAAAGEAEA